MGSIIQRDSLMQCYLENQTAYLKALHPQMKLEEISKFVRNVIETKINRPKAKVITHPSPGNTELKSIDLLSHIKQNSNKIITPCGTVYKSTEEQVAFDKQFIDMLRNNRDIAKKQMLKYAAEGRTQEEALEDFKQSLCKILVNSIIGSNGNDKNAMYDLESFNGVTSMARHGVIMAYAYAERFLASNFYFPNIEHAINYIITTKHYCPPREVIYAITEKYKLVNPLPCEVADMLLTGLEYYDMNYSANKLKLNQILESLPLHEVTFIYYSRNLYNLFTMNSTFWKKWIYDFTHHHEHLTDFDITFNIGADKIVPEDLRKLDGDLLQVIATIYSQELKGVQIKKIPNVDPNLALKLYLIGLDMQKQLNDISDLLDTFIHNDTFVAHIHSQRNIVRKTVAISDTDSVIFTTKDLIHWYTQSDNLYSQNSYNVNAIIVYFLTKSIASIIRKMSISRGATGDNIDMIEMKNEYLYPVLIKTNLGKHYAGSITVQEGNFLPSPKLDIKGVSFMSSNVPKVSHTFLESFLERIQSEIMEYNNIYAADFIMMAYDYERKIVDSLNKGEFTYFTNISIKSEEEYKKPEASVYSNYLFWQEVFSYKYGNINIPTKVLVIPIHHKQLTHHSYLDWLQSINPKLHKKLVTYLDKIGKKAINRIPLSADLTVVPEEILPLINSRPIVYKNMAAVQLALKSLGIDLGSQKKMPLLSDYYSLETLKM